MFKRLLSYAALASALVFVVTPASAAIGIMRAQSQNSTIMIVATPDYVVQPPAPEPTTAPPVIITTAPPSTTAPPTTAAAPTTTTTAPPTSTTALPTTTTAPVTTTSSPPPTTQAQPPPTAPASTGVPDDNPVLQIDTNGQVTSGGVNKIDLTTENSISSAAEYVQIMTLIVEPGTNAWQKDGSRLETIDFKQVTAASLPPLPGGVKPLSAVVELGPEGCYFTKSLNLTLSYDPQAAKGLNQKAFYIACYDGSSVFPLYCTVDAVNHTVTATLSRISSVYTILPGAPSRPFNWWWLLLLLLPALLFALLRPRLVFITRSQQLGVGEVSAVMTVQARNRAGIAQKLDRGITLTLACSSETGRFDIRRDGAFDGSVKAVVMPARSRQTSFYFRDGAAGSPGITVSETPQPGRRPNRREARQSQSVKG